MSRNLHKFETQLQQKRSIAAVPPIDDADAGHRRSSDFSFQCR
jgi:hypothetical protein